MDPSYKVQPRSSVSNSQHKTSWSPEDIKVFAKRAAEARRGRKGKMVNSRRVGLGRVCVRGPGAATGVWRRGGDETLRRAFFAMVRAVEQNEKPPLRMCTKRKIIGKYSPTPLISENQGRSMSRPDTEPQVRESGSSL